jgi:hypothetical protein
MANQFTNPEMPPRVGTNDLPLPPPLRRAESAFASKILATQAEDLASETDQLKSEGEAEARGWKPAGTEGHEEILQRKWSEAARAVKSGLRQARQLAADGEAANISVQDLHGAARLLEVALNNAQELLAKARDLPVIETADQTVIPRAYAAVAAYLRTAQFRFEESAFAAFFTGIQEIQVLKLSELWTLKSLLELALLEEVGRTAQNLFSPTSEPGARGTSEEGNHARGAAAGSAIPDLIACLRSLDFAPWREICEQIGAVHHILSTDPSGAFPRMDAESRDMYLGQTDQLGRFSEVEEAAIARRAIALARFAQQETDLPARLRERRSHVGFYLVGEGRALLEEQIHYRPPAVERLRKAVLAWPEVYYLVGIELLTFAIIAFLLVGVRAPVSLIVSLILLSLPVTEAATGVMNQLTVSFLSPRPLPKLDFSEGIPRECSTLVVVPTLLLNEAYVRRMVAELEIRFLANRDPNLYFALLTDAPDSP